MKREIKFRAWDKENKVMIENNSQWYEKEHIGKEITFNSCVLPLWNSNSGVVLEYYEKLGKYGFEGEEIASCEIMQYTGLKDKNGREIYEGDIIRLRNGVVKEVRFGEYCFTGGEYSTQGIGFYLYSREDKGMFGSYDFPTKSDEIIGDIYQNKDLLNG